MFALIFVVAIVAFIFLVIAMIGDFVLYITKNDKKDIDKNNNK